MKAWGIIMAIALASGAARADAKVDAFNAKARAELEAQAPAALAAWDEGGLARNADHFAAAVAAYRRVVELAPGFAHGHRRLCVNLVRLSQAAEGVAECRKAVALSDDVVNGSALADALAQMPGGESEATAGFDRWLPAEVELNSAVVLCEAAAYLKDAARLERCSDRLRELDPTAAVTHRVGTLASILSSRWAEARSRLAKARAAGLDDASYDQLRAFIDEADPPRTWLIWAAWIFGGWFVLFGLVLLAGFILSALTLRAAARPAELGVNARPGEHRLRRVYAGVLFVTVILFYASYPLVMLTVLVVGGGLVYGIVMTGHIPVKLVLLIVVGIAVSLWAMLKSLFARGSDADPGSRLDLAQHPRLVATLKEVARRIGTRPVDSVYLTIGTEFAVMERRKRKERCLIVGVAGLDGLGLVELKSILGHEYGHFRNADTAGGSLALAVQRRLMAIAIGLGRGGAAHWYNPAWLFVRGFWATFARVSHGATRLQEILADRWAVFAYGSEAFARGLRHFIARSVAFNWHTKTTLKEVVDAKVPVANFYRHEPKLVGDARTQIDEATRKAVERAAEATDSHPPPALRIQWALAMNVTGPEAEEQGAAWDLFADRAAIEQQMTDEIRQNLKRRYGVTLAST